MILFYGVTEETVMASNGEISLTKDLAIWDGPTANGLAYSLRIMALLLYLYHPEATNKRHDHKQLVLAEINVDEFNEALKKVANDVDNSVNPLASARIHRNEFGLKIMALTDRVSDIESYVKGDEPDWRKTIPL